MDKSDFLLKLRRYLADPDGKIFNDLELLDYLEKALQQYSIDTGAFISKFEFHPDALGIYHYPDDFTSFLIGWNKEGKEIVPSTGSELFKRTQNYSLRAGNPQYIYDDRHTNGTYSLYPVPENNQDFSSCVVTPLFGEIIDSDYGVYQTSEYGVTLSVAAFRVEGEIYYRRTGRFEEVKDYQAIIYYAMSLAYLADSEFSDPQKSFFWKQQYDYRVNAYNMIQKDNCGEQVSGNFY